MLNRRHIRIKVLQTIYAMHQSGSDVLDKEERFLITVIENIQDLYLVMISTLTEIRKKEMEFIEISKNKHLATPEERNPNTKFINNQVLLLLNESRSLENALEQRKVNYWSLNDDYILLLLEAIKQSDLYKQYMDSKEQSFESDKRFVIDIFTEIIACNEKLYDYLEDVKLSWVDDIPLVNTTILKQLKQLSDSADYVFTVPKVYKDVDDKDFGIQLFRKTVLNEEALANEYIQRTPNWDPDRIAEVDTIMLKMAICEFTKFPSIPVKVTINEYLEIAKEYSTPKSSIFINGILDGFVKEFQNTDKIRKSGRGLM